MEPKGLTTAKKFLGQFATLDNLDTSLRSILVEDYNHEYAPASANLPSFKARDDYINHMSHVSRIIAGMVAFPKEFIESKNQITIWATTETHFRAHAKDDGIPDEDWQYKGEYVFLLWLDESGEKITRCVEFVDSKKAEQFGALIRRATENVKRRAAASSS